MGLTWSKLNYCAWFDSTVCEQPVLACPCLSAVAMRAFTWVVFAPGFFPADTVLYHECKFEIYGNFGIHSFNLNFRYMATRKQAYITHESCNAVPLL